jgi:hypothetical protein
VSTELLLDARLDWSIPRVAWQHIDSILFSSGRNAPEPFLDRRLKRRAEVLSLLAALPRAVEADHGEVFAFVESNRVMGRRLGWVDAHLLASALLTGTLLWTLDRRLSAEARALGVGLD